MAKAPKPKRYVVTVDLYAGTGRGSMDAHVYADVEIEASSQAAAKEAAVKKIRSGNLDGFRLSGLAMISFKALVARSAD